MKLRKRAVVVGLVVLFGTTASAVLAMRWMEGGPVETEQRKRSTKAKKATLAGFDGDRAYKYLIEQCEMGRRVAGTEQNHLLQAKLVEHFEKCGAEASIQEFTGIDPSTRKRVKMGNVVAKFFPERKRRVVLGAHFDTRPFADEELNPQRRLKTPFLGANDGASGVALLMELGNMLPKLETSVGVDLVMFDAEELVYQRAGTYFLGSTHFAQNYAANHRRDGYTYVAGIVVDMVADKRLEIMPDHMSWENTPDLVREVWGVAKELGVRNFRDQLGYNIRDDHEPLIRAGIPAIDIIDFDYPHWHKVTDTPDKCSAASLAKVGGVVAEWLRRK